MISSSIVKSLEGIYYFLFELVPSESQNPASIESQNHFSPAVQGRTTGGRDRVRDFGDRDRGRDHSSGHSGGREVEVIYYHYCKKSDNTKYNFPLL